MTSKEIIALTQRYCAHNYKPKEVVISEGEGAVVRDPEGREYYDMLSAYSALNFGHRHPELVAAAKEQLDKVTLTSRAFHSELLGAFAERLAALTGMQAVLPMNTGAEAVETAIKTAPEGKQNIVCCRGNFHGRTVTVVSMSTDPTARAGYGPFTPGFRAVEYGDARAIEEAIDQNTAAVLLEPIQGEAGVSAERAICSRVCTRACSPISTSSAKRSAAA